MNSSKIDPITAATAFASMLFGPEMAEYIGPYAVILVGSTTGAGWALGRADPMASRLEAILFFTRLNLMGLLLTVPFAAGAKWAFDLNDSNWMLVPIALLIGAVGNDWPVLGRWILTRVGRLFERRTNTED